MRGEKTDLLKTVTAMATAGGERPWRKDVFNEIIGEYTIDTCNTVDAGWETGIEPPNKPWIIVESYETREMAEKGHNKWVAYVKGGGRDFPDNQP